MLALDCGDRTNDSSGPIVEEVGDVDRLVAFHDCELNVVGFEKHALLELAETVILLGGDARLFPDLVSLVGLVRQSNGRRPWEACARRCIDTYGNRPKAENGCTQGDHQVHPAEPSAA